MSQAEVSLEGAGIVAHPSSSVVEQGSAWDLQGLCSSAAVQGMSKGRTGTTLTRPVGQTGGVSQHQCSVLILLH